MASSFHPTPTMFLIVCPFLFLAGLVDSIAGGGGLISLPAYMITGMPMHFCVATNKLSSTCGTTVATTRFIKNRLIDLRLALPSIAAGVVGSIIGSHISLMMPEDLIKKILLFVLPVAAFFVLNKNIFKDNPDEDENAKPSKRTYLVATLAALIIGCYDGLYGPGTGTFLIIAFTVFAKMSIKRANAQAKVINLTSNVTALVVFLVNGQAVIPLGLAGAACSIAGNYVGSGLVMTRGAKVVKPILIVVLVLLFIKIVSGM
ncbi:MAG: TSUP family transporter [Lachnospiraceae bacterium]|nr:TSUP family transporter [Lachnospiraceae bacterium]